MLLRTSQHVVDAFKAAAICLNGDAMGLIATLQIPHWGKEKQLVVSPLSVVMTAALPHAALVRHLLHVLGSGTGQDLLRYTFPDLLFHCHEAQMVQGKWIVGHFVFINHIALVLEFLDNIIPSLQRVHFNLGELGWRVFSTQIDDSNRESFNVVSAQPENL